MRNINKILSVKIFGFGIIECIIALIVVAFLGTVATMQYQRHKFNTAVKQGQAQAHNVKEQILLRLSDNEQCPGEQDASGTRRSFEFENIPESYTRYINNIAYREGSTGLTESDGFQNTDNIACHFTVTMNGDSVGTPGTNPRIVVAFSFAGDEIVATSRCIGFQEGANLTECDEVIQNVDCPDTARPVWDGVACIPCPDATPVWSGSACEACNRNQYFDGRSCQPCADFSENCISCSDSACIACQVGQYLNRGVCTACPAGATCDGVNATCNVAGMTISGNACGCASNQYVLTDGDGNESCAACPVGATCDGVNATCNVVGMTISGNACGCASNQYVLTDGDGNQLCTVCPDNATCNGTNFTCAAGFTTAAASCDCPQGSSTSGAGVGTGVSGSGGECRCDSVHLVFKNVDGEMQCVGCGKGEYIPAGGGSCQRCDSTYPGCTACSAAGCTTCADNNYYLSNGQCESCPQHATCSATDFSCDSGFMKDQPATGECGCPTNATHYGDVGLLPITAGQQIAGSNCYCNKGFEKWHNEVCQGCVTAPWSISDKQCKDCESNEYADSNNVCQPCSSKYGNNCKQCSATECSKCQEDYYYLSNGQCEDCPKNAICTNGIEFTCKGDMVKDYPKAGECGCPNDKPNWNGSRCEACRLPNPFWDGEKCTTCPSPKSWNGNQCVCPVSAPIEVKEWVAAAVPSLTLGSCANCAQVYPDGSRPHYIASVPTCDNCAAAHNGYKDYDVNAKSCRPCPSPGRYASMAGHNSYQGGAVPGTNCRCQTNTSWSTQYRECMVNCPEGASMSGSGPQLSGAFVGHCSCLNNKFEIVTEYRKQKCSCKLNYQLNADGSDCVALPPCAGGSVRGEREFTGQKVSSDGCQCPANIPSWNGNRCVACNTGTYFDGHRCRDCPDGCAKCVPGGSWTSDTPVPRYGRAPSPPADRVGFHRVPYCTEYK
jgi:type II secretory pathway pseudopilin PulG